MRKLEALVIAALLFQGCGTSSEDAPEGSVSHLHFILLGQGVTGLVAKAKQPKLRFCLAGVSESSMQPWVDKIKGTVGKWLKPLQAFTSDRITSEVEVVDSRQGACDADVTVADGVWANTETGQHPTVNMATSGYFSNYNVMLHEMGHAFALSDTYQNSQSGNCQPGQPQAVMCNTSFDDVQPDDVKGLESVFKQAFPNDKPGEPPPQTPPPTGGTTPPPTSSVKLFAALETGDSSAKLLAAASGAPASTTDAMAVCAGAPSACKDTGATWTPLTRAGSRGDVPVWTTAALTLTDGMAVTLRFGSGQTAVLQGLQIKKK